MSWLSEAKEIRSNFLEKQMYRIVYRTICQWPREGNQHTSELEQGQNGLADNKKHYQIILLRPSRIWSLYRLDTTELSGYRTERMNWAEQSRRMQNVVHTNWCQYARWQNYFALNKIFSLSCPWNGKQVHRQDNVNQELLKRRGRGKLDIWAHYGQPDRILNFLLTELKGFRNRGSGWKIVPRSSSYWSIIQREIGILQKFCMMAVDLSADSLVFLPRTVAIASSEVWCDQWALTRELGRLLLLSTFHLTA